MTSLRQVLAFLIRDLRAWSSYRLTVLLQLASIFFVLTVFFFIGEAVQIRDASSIREYSDQYFPFLLPGLAIAGFVTASLSGFSGHLREAQISGTLETLLVTPISIPTLVVGSTLWDYLSATVRFFGFLAVGAVVFQVPLHLERFPGVALVLVLMVIAFSGIGLLSAAFVMAFKRGDPVGQPIAWFSMLLGGVYFPVRSVGDPALSSAASLLPVTPALDALRLLLLRGATLADIAPQLRSLGIFGAVLLPLGLFAFAAGIRHARRTGSLTHY